MPKEKIKKAVHIILIIAVIIVMLVIIGFTLQKPEESLYISTTVQTSIVTAVGAGNDGKWEKWEYNQKVFRQYAHSVEYFVLGVFVAGAIATSSRSEKPAYMIGKHLLFCSLFSITDQSIKGVLPYKEFDHKDLLFDLVGYTSAVILFILISLLLYIPKKKYEGEKMSNMLFEKDLFRVCGDCNIGFLKRCHQLFKNEGLRYIWHWRNQTGGEIGRFVHKVAMLRLRSRTGLELNSNNIGPGLLLVHPYCITVNRSVKAGKNLTLLKGCTIGSVKGSGEKAGAPTIGDNVYIGLNATVVGGITIGNDVLIAANSFVDFDVPSHSVVVGNPATIHSKANATQAYITNAIEL